MRENTRTALNIALTHLQVQRQEIDTAITAILAVLGEADMVPVSQTGPARPAPPLKGAKVTRKGTTATGKSAVAATKPPTTSRTLMLADEIVGHLKHKGPLGPKAIRDDLELSARECKQALRELVADKRIVGEGATSQRRYRLAATKVVKAARTSSPPPLVATDDEYETVWNGASPQPLSAANGGLS